MTYKQTSNNRGGRSSRLGRHDTTTRHDTTQYVADVDGTDDGTDDGDDSEERTGGIDGTNPTMRTTRGENDDDDGESDDASSSSSPGERDYNVDSSDDGKRKFRRLETTRNDDGNARADVGDVERWVLLHRVLVGDGATRWTRRWTGTRTRGGGRVRRSADADAEIRLGAANEPGGGDVSSDGRYICHRVRCFAVGTPADGRFGVLGGGGGEHRRGVVERAERIALGRNDARGVRVDFRRGERDDERGVVVVDDGEKLFRARWRRVVAWAGRSRKRWVVRRRGSAEASASFPSSIQTRRRRRGG